jgi:cell division topological specificity factor
MTLFGFFKACRAAPVARERLQILLAHERVALGPRDLVAILRDELLATIARHVEIDSEKVKVTMDRAGAYSTLEIDVEIPCDKIASGASRGDVPSQASGPSFRQGGDSTFMLNTRLTEDGNPGRASSGSMP